MAKRTKQLTQVEEMKDEIRINKYLSEAGACSRREADVLIEQGKVTINGEIASIGSKVKKGDHVTLLGKTVIQEGKLAFIVLNKPRGIVCTTDLREPDNIIDFVNYKSRIFPIGRLDKDSEGLILLTNDGNIVNKILRAEHEHEKEYVVQVNKPITDDFLEKMASGVPILDTVTKPCVITQEGKDVFRIILTQGLNRQIRRMCEFLGYRVLRLQRVRIMNITLGRLKEGCYRNVTDKELESMMESIRESVESGTKKRSAVAKVNKTEKVTKTSSPRSRVDAGVRKDKSSNKACNKASYKPSNSNKSGNKSSNSSIAGNKSSNSNIASNKPSNSSIAGNKSSNSNKVSNKPSNKYSNKNSNKRSDTSSYQPNPRNEYKKQEEKGFGKGKTKIETNSKRNGNIRNKESGNNNIKKKNSKY